MLLGREVVPKVALATTIVDTINSIYDRALNEAEQVVEAFGRFGIPLVHVDAEQRFLERRLAKIKG
jgi:GMP synthase PP-ATPase subunit